MPHAAQNAAWSVGAPALVSVTLLKGDTVRGYLEGLSAAAATLTLLDPSQPSARAVLATFDIEELACVAFVKGCALRPAPPGDGERWRVRLSGGSAWLVHSSAESLSHPLGCMACPVGDERFEAVYFYAHAVDLRERDLPLGSLLLKLGALDPSALDMGVARQAGDRSIQIGRILIEQAKADPLTLDEAAELQKRKGARIGEVLQEAGLISGEELDSALLEQQRRKGRRLGEALVALGLLSERELAIALGQKFGLAFVNLAEARPAAAALSLVGSELAAKYHILPLSDDGRTLTVVVSDPTNAELVDVLRRSTKRHVRLLIATSSELKRAIETYVSVRPAPSAAAPADTTSDAKSALQEDGIGRVIAQVISDALRRQVTEIHLESNGKERNVSVRYRVNGSCPLQTLLPPIVRHALISRIKALAKLDAQQRSKPQAGSMRWQIAGQPAVQLRVMTLPTSIGEEDIAIHVRPRPTAIALSATGLTDAAVSKLERAMAAWRGLLICAGPEASGKTTMLAALMGALEQREARTFVIDDMSEALSEGTRHISVQPELDRGYAQALHAALHAGGDIISVGALEGPETIRLTADAVLRGRLVLGAMAVRNAYEACLSLSNAGLSGPMLAEILRAVVTTRTVRRLCQQCAVRESASAHEYDRLVEACGRDAFMTKFGIRSADALDLWRPSGCARCEHTGYQGRVGLQHVLVAEDELQPLLGSEPFTAKARDALGIQIERELLLEGARHVLAGELDLPQLLQTCGPRAPIGWARH